MSDYNWKAVTHVDKKTGEVNVDLATLLLLEEEKEERRRNRPTPAPRRSEVDALTSQYSSWKKSYQ